MSRATIPQPLDQVARDRISRELDCGHFVQAGAGSGKTTQIITRIISLVREGIPLKGIAAITFTEKAAADLRRRLRKQLEKEQKGSERGGDGSLLSQALDSLDAAPIGTIHSFARRLLAENPIEARVPPGFQVRNELATSIDRQALWQKQRQALFRDPHLRSHVEPLLELGVSESDFEELSRQFDEYWDRLETFVPGVDSRDSLAELRARIDELLQLSGQCLKPEKDSLVARIASIVEVMESFDETDPNDFGERGRILSQLPTIHQRVGAKTNWPPGVLDEGRRIGAELKDLAARCFFEMIQPPVIAVQQYFRDMSIERANARRLDGVLNFQDLLVLARNLLRSDENTWTALSQRYPRIIVDEFQDTDPLQADIVCRLAAVRFDPDTHWSSLELRPGALLTVGDPKQSIYRFRGADINTYFSHRDRDPGLSGQETIELTTNFRSTPNLLEWVNVAFNTLIQANARIQPAFVPLDSAPIQDGLPPLMGPAVTIIGSGEVAVSSAAARSAEASDVVHAVLQAVGRIPGVPGWTKQVRDDGPVRSDDVTLSDICILIPSRTSLPPLENALREADIEFVSEASSVVYSTVEVQALLLATRAIANTADEASLVLALRSPLFGLGDDELLQWHTSGRRWSVFDEAVSADSELAVGRALHILHRLVLALPGLTPSDLLETLVNECFFYEKAVFAGAGRRAWWRRVRYVVDQAEAWYQTTGGSLRDYLTWAEIQQDESTRVTEAITPEIGDDALHIMTVHMAKGLEFPVVMLAGGMSGPKNDRPTVLWDEFGAPHLILTKKTEGGFPVQTMDYSDVFEREKEARNEEYRRLYYVACTRAESHLVVSAHRHKKTPKIAFASLLVEAETVGLPEMGTLEGEKSERLPPANAGTKRSVPTASLDAWTDWQANVLRLAKKKRSASVTSLAHESDSDFAQGFFTSLGITAPHPTPSPLVQTDEGAEAVGDSSSVSLDKKKSVRFVNKEDLVRKTPNETDQDSPDIVQSEAKTALAGGAAFGSALHWVMEMSDLTHGDHLGVIVDQAVDRFGVKEKEVLARTVEAALNNDTVMHARDRRHWLELSLRLSHDDVAVDGAADLVFEDDDGTLVVVDFKTDRFLSEETLGAYWAQLSIYAVILARVTGKKSERCVIVHCPPTGEPAQTLEYSRVVRANTPEKNL